MVRNTIILVGLALVTGCSSSSKEHPLIPHSDQTMQEIYDDSGAISAKANFEVLSVTKRPPTQKEFDYNNYEINQMALRPEFKKLPNPTLYLYFAPRISENGMPIPAWMTEIQMYDQEQYALPGELSKGGNYE